MFRCLLLTLNNEQAAEPRLLTSIFLNTDDVNKRDRCDPFHEDHTLGETQTRRTPFDGEARRVGCTPQHSHDTYETSETERMLRLLQSL